jgi:hypothetical protein
MLAVPAPTSGGAINQGVIAVSPNSVFFSHATSSRLVAVRARSADAVPAVQNRSSF